MNVRPLHTEADYDWALAEIEPYFREQPAMGSPDADRFDVLATLIGAYEAERWPIAPTDPIAILNYAITDLGRSQAELAELLGSRSHASEVLSRKRPLSLEMIRRVGEAWEIPTDLLIGRYPLDDAA